MKKIISRLYYFWLFVLPILSYHFYGYVGINEQISKMIFFVMVLLAFWSALPAIIKVHKNNHYVDIMRMFIFISLISACMAYIFWGQSPILSYLSTASFLGGIIYFFLLLQAKPDIKFIEKFIWFYCIIYLLIWTYQMIKYPEIVFYQETDEDNMSRGIRLYIKGVEFLYLGFFLAINKFVETRKNFWIFIFVGLFFVIIFHLTRFVIIGSFFIGLFYLYYNRNKKLLVWLAMLIIVLLFSPFKISEDGTLGTLNTLTQNQIESQQSGENNTRIIEYEYFFTKYSKNIITDFFGNGIAHSQSTYGIREIKLKNTLEIFLSDVGYAQIFCYFGYFGLFWFCLVFYRVWKQKVPENVMFSKLFIIFLFFTNIAAGQILYNIISFSIGLYILEYYYHNKKLVIANEKENLYISKHQEDK